MDDKLKNLKGSMKTTVFRDVTFSNKHKSIIRNKVKEMPIVHMNELFYAIQSEKTGYEIIETLLTRGNENYLQQEGLLYIELHKYEQLGYLTSHWKEHNEQKEKYYSLTKKGKKILTKSKVTFEQKINSLNEWPEGNV